MKKIILILMTLICVTACVFGFAACGDTTPKHTHDYSSEWTTDTAHHWHECKTDGCDSKQKDKAAHSDADNNGKCDVCDYQMLAPYIKMDKFMSENSTIANMFVDDYIRPQAILAADEDVKSETCTLTPSSSKEELHSVQFAYTTKISETERALKVTTATLKKDLLLEDIVKHYSSKTNLDKTLEADVDISTETIFEFDAKTNYAKQNIADAVYNALSTTSEVKLYNQQDSSTRKDYSLMTYLQKEGKTYTVHSFEVRKDENEENFISKINSEVFRRDEKTVSTHTLDGELLYDNGYTLEQFQEIPPVIEYEEKTITAEEITTALDENYKEAAIKSCFTNKFEYNENLLVSGNWYVLKDENGKITDAEYVFDYKESNVDGYLGISKLKFNSSLDVKDLIDGNVPNTTYTRDYRLNYNPSIQETRKDLTDAICNKVFETNGIVQNRYIIDKGFAESDSQLSGTVEMFKVIEVTDKGVQETNINIKSSENDAGYINRLNNEEDYRVFNKSSKDITGKEVEDVTILVEKVQTTKTASKARATSARATI